MKTPMLSFNPTARFLLSDLKKIVGYCIFLPTKTN